jgi:hypothetical protein
MSRMAEDLRGRLERLAPQLNRSKAALPPGTPEGLRHIGVSCLLTGQPLKGMRVN